METKFNFKSDICTSREQSEKLLALGLSKETADCHWAYHSVTATRYVVAHPCDGVGECIPAWSCGRLVEIMPTTIKSRYGYVNLAVNAELVQYQYYDEDYMHNECCQHFNDGTLYDNIIDCIEWLIKEGYFNKEYLV